jgi:hypothetical protein
MSQGRVLAEPVLQLKGPSRLLAFTLNSGLGSPATDPQLPSWPPKCCSGGRSVHPSQRHPLVLGSQAGSTPTQVLRAPAGAVQSHRCRSGRTQPITGVSLSHPHPPLLHSSGQLQRNSGSCPPAQLTLKMQPPSGSGRGSFSHLSAAASSTAGHTCFYWALCVPNSGESKMDRELELPLSSMRAKLPPQMKETSVTETVWEQGQSTRLGGEDLQL